MSRKERNMSYNYYEQHKEEMKQKARERRANNLQLYKQRQKALREKNGKIWAENVKKKRAQNGDEIRAKEKQWRDNNKQKKAELDRRYREKKKAEKNAIQLIPFKELEEKYNHVRFLDYEVFEDGSIWSWRYFKFMNGSKDLQEYQNIQVRLNKQRIGLKRSRFIALAFDGRTYEELKNYECHHCSMVREDNSISNLVFLPKQLHQKMHNKLSKEQILLIGQQVKHLRGSAKTNKFVELVGLFL